MIFRLHGDGFVSPCCSMECTQKKYRYALFVRLSCWLQHPEAFTLFCSFTQSHWSGNLGISWITFIFSGCIQLSKTEFPKCVWFDNNSNLPTKPVWFPLTALLSYLWCLLSRAIGVALILPEGGNVKTLNSRMHFLFGGDNKAICTGHFTYCWGMKAKHRPKVGMFLISLAEWRALPTTKSVVGETEEKACLYCHSGSIQLLENTVRFSILIF